MTMFELHLDESILASVDLFAGSLGMSRDECGIAAWRQYMRFYQNKLAEAVENDR